MKRTTKSFAAILLAAMAGGGAVAGAEDTVTGPVALHLTPGVMELLRGEMRALVEGMESLPRAIATADWEHVADTGARIDASYVLAQKLTPDQREELETNLPGHFKRLDGGFHNEAARLEAAALNQDAQLVTFHYYRLLESCTYCHSIYATSRFPGFVSGTGGVREP